jgi:hypothetical protein
VLAALLNSILTPIPANLPAAALGQPALYRLEITLLVFYGCLALVTPAFAALVSGRLPIEISTRGARFADGADQAAEQDEMTIKKLEQTTERLDVGLATTMSRVDQLEMQSDRK